MITNPLMYKISKVTAQSLMSYANLKYEDIRVGNNGAFLNYNVLGICSDPNCSYRHKKANPTKERTKAVKTKL